MKRCSVCKFEVNDEPNECVRTVYWPNCVVQRTVRTGQTVTVVMMLQTVQCGGTE